MAEDELDVIQMSCFYCKLVGPISRASSRSLISITFSLCLGIPVSVFSNVNCQQKKVKVDCCQERGSVLYYCGRDVGTDGYANFCGDCDGTCGPDNGMRSACIS